MLNPGQRRAGRCRREEGLGLKRGYLQHRSIAALSQEGAIGQGQAGFPLRCAPGVEDLHAGLELSACPRACGDPRDKFIHWIQFQFIWSISEVLTQCNTTAGEGV